MSDAAKAIAFAVSMMGLEVSAYFMGRTDGKRAGAHLADECVQAWTDDHAEQRKLLERGKQTVAAQDAALGECVHLVRETEDVAQRCADILTRVSKGDIVFTPSRAHFGAQP